MKKWFAARRPLPKRHANPQIKSCCNTSQVYRKNQMQQTPNRPGLGRLPSGKIVGGLVEAASVALVGVTIGTVCCWAVVETSAGELGRPGSEARSLRMDLSRPLDELDLPRYRERETNRGWEIRTRHFVVFSTIGREKAAWAAEELEAAWQSAGRLADQWTDVHRRDAFGVGAVGVMLTDGQRRSGGGPAAGPPAGPRDTNFGAMIFLNADDEAAPIEERLHQLRREGVAAFLRVTGQDYALPEWVRVGLGGYLSGEELPADEIRSLQSPKMDSGGAAAAWARRITSDAMAGRGPDLVESELWVRYLLEGDDGRHAPRFFDALSKAIDSVPPEVHLRGADWLDLERMTADSAVREGMTDWLADREAGQPQVRPKPEEMRLDERQGRMMLILKLAGRFALPANRSVRTKVVEFREGVASTLVSTPVKDTPMTPAALFRRLVALPRWATIDTDGSLLVSDNHERLAEIFGLSDPNVRYRMLRRDGDTVLKTAYLDTGETFEAWLENDPENPRRPVGHVQRRDYQPEEPPPEAKTKDAAYRASDGRP